MYLVLKRGIPIGLYTSSSDAINSVKNLKLFKIFEVQANDNEVKLFLDNKSKEAKPQI
jgi:hypothetical protein